MVTNSRQSLGKRTRSSYSISSSPPVSPIAPSPSNKRPKTVSFTLTNNDDPNANKENIPPLPDFLEALTARDLRAKARRSSTSSTTPTRALRRPSAGPSLTLEDSPSEKACEPATPPRTPRTSNVASFNDLDKCAVLPAPRFGTKRPSQTPSRAMSTLTLATPPSTPYTSLHSRARALLRTTAESASVIGRDAERKQILSFLDDFLSSDPPTSSVATSMYISGSPGTGKTALVSSILRTHQAFNGETVTSVYVNCMGLKDINVLWDRVLTAIGQMAYKGRIPASSLSRLERALKRVDFKCVLILDEVDTFPPASLSTIFALPARFSTSLRLIAISNDLAQSTSSPTLASHGPSATLPFAAYTASEMQDILRSRLALLAESDDEEIVRAVLAQIIQPPALTLLVKKVAAQTGDIRLALDVLRRALDIVASCTISKPVAEVSAGSAPPSPFIEAPPPPPPAPIGMKDVLDALKRTSAKASSVSGSRGPLDSVISTLGFQARLVLLAVLIGRKRVNAGLSMDILSIPRATSSKSLSKIPSTPTKPRAQPSDASKLYSLYTHILDAPAAAGLRTTTFDAVSRNEFTDLLSVLETSSLISVPPPSASVMSSPTKSPSKKRGLTRTASSTNGAGGDVELVVREEDVVKALVGGSGVKEDELERIWLREVKRIERTTELLERREEEEAATARVVPFDE